MTIRYHPIGPARLRMNALLPRIRRALPLVARWLGSVRYGVYGLAIGAIWAYVMTADFNELLAAERERTAQAQAQRDQLHGWIAGRKVRVVLEGEPGQVANLAGQLSNAVRP